VVRAARAPIRERGRVRNPDLVVIADETLVPVTSAGVLEGVDEATWLLIRSEVPAADWARRLGRRGRLLTLPAPAAERVELPTLGATCAGAAARLVGVLSRASLEHALRDELAPLGAEALAESRSRALEAFDRLAGEAGCVSEGPDPSAAAGARPDWVELPAEPAARSAPDVRVPLSSAQVRTGLWRSLRPVIDHQLCHRCAWVCSTFCPDGAISIDAEGRPGIDYDHCKGCLVCAAVCPPHAIRVEPERGQPLPGQATP
jgi:pyruvate ferredoxin oxidoreductase gamma subunit